MCISLSLSKHSFFIRTDCHFGHTHPHPFRDDQLKENEINECRIEFESSLVCIIDFVFPSALAFADDHRAVKFYNDETPICSSSLSLSRLNTYRLGLLCLRRLLLLLIGAVAVC